jgi:uncharacterized membrane protein YheB (UPF0754 family)
MEAQAPVLWKSLPQNSKNKIIGIIEKELPEVIKNLMEDLKINIDDILDLKSLAISALLEDKALINRIFLSVGNKEFKFIERSCFYFGFLFGIVQAIVFYLYNPWWVLVLFGVLVGFATNFLALHLIFRPLYPKKFLGITFQGIFLKRQETVAKEYAYIIKTQILTIERIFDFTLRGPKQDRFSDLSKYHTDKLIDAVVKKSSSLSKLINIEKKNKIHKKYCSLPFYGRITYCYAIRISICQ